MANYSELASLTALHYSTLGQPCYINRIYQDRAVVHCLFTFLDHVSAVLFGLTCREAYTEGYRPTYFDTKMPHHATYICTRLPRNILSRRVVGRGNTQLHEMLQEWVGQEYRYSSAVGQFLHREVYGDTSGEAEKRLIQRYKDWHTSWHALRNPYDQGDAWYPCAITVILHDPTRRHNRKLWKSFWEKTAVYVDFIDKVRDSPRQLTVDELKNDDSSESTSIPLTTRISTTDDLQSHENASGLFMAEIQPPSLASIPVSSSLYIQLDIENSKPPSELRVETNSRATQSENLFYDSGFLSYDSDIREQPFEIDDDSECADNYVASSVDTSDDTNIDFDGNSTGSWVRDYQESFFESCRVGGQAEEDVATDDSFIKKSRQDNVLVSIPLRPKAKGNK